ncbi:hypothetical protein NX722_08990 [Endozoicomonas gorgoniicola]|uniref:Uncharacterized protein n=1 Tax=Endozoicomonas gorgoniicola TaxID=1234144 RepID=A0ABT3MTT9_9GAMM|nr:hypothetical protein [Endozoicomonas gorgoniicola]MCW7552775.1 hypothetical protein [Endozoicomonas gorgoniicola]
MTDTETYYGYFGWYDIEEGQMHRGDVRLWTLDMWLLDSLIGPFVQDMLFAMGIKGTAQNRAYVNILKAMNIKCGLGTDCYFNTVNGG